MRTSVIFSLFPLTALAAPAAAPSSGCAAVGIITARASTEAPGEGIIGTLAAEIQDASSLTVSRTSVDYPALLYPYAPSVASGVAAMTADLKAAVDACPDQKIVLLGYSQGAQCVTDTLGGGGGGALDDATTPAIDYASYGSHVVAGIMMGDPRFVTSESAIHVGDCTQDGLFPRLANQSLTQYDSVLQTYCDEGDPFCCSGLDTLVHLGYETEYGTQALAFVMGKLGSTVATTTNTSLISSTSTEKSSGPTSTPASASRITSGASRSMGFSFLSGEIGFVVFVATFFYL